MIRCVLHISQRVNIADNLIPLKVKDFLFCRKTVDSTIENLSSLGLVKKVQRHREDGTRTSNLYYVASLLGRVNFSLG